MHYTQLKDEGIEKLSFLALISNVLHEENSILDEYITKNAVDKELAKKKIIKVMGIIQKVGIAPKDFF
jgi:hypothetical protein